MTHTFPELVIEGVLVAPFVTYFLAALVVVAVLRPILHLVGFAKILGPSPVAEFSLYVTILCLLMLLF
ncbi:DUF1656 domain-containing protein [Rhizobium calliandrae]|uniref:DUF1656 domain-containing protein n=1 Tax=Rhizobium calliandrae TaxID=1312182 RepID=A0ABT7KPN5_9HYPH|nr:DUF1656 domain-containing protein [Rhizobium calliandrae]MDL2410102.1 DUF1656 domain-containing protein [Rhizobium calliandrae]